MNKFHWFVRKVIGPLIRIVMPTMVKGVENLPKSGAMLCPNHSSNWDPVPYPCAGLDHQEAGRLPGGSG